MPSVEIYLQGSPEDGGYRPVVEILVTIGNETRPIRALVDTGADLSVLPTDIVEAMAGVPFADLEGIDGTLGGIGTDDTGMPSKMIECTARYGGRTFADHITVGAVPRAVVGRRDFLKQFNARFYWNRDPPEFYLDPADLPRAARRAIQSGNPTIRPRRKR